MSAKTTTAAIRDAVKLVEANGGNVKAAARKAGIGYFALLKRYRLGTRGEKKPAEPEITAPPTLKEDFHVDGSDAQTVVTARSKTVRTLDGVIETAKVDLAIWEVERWVANKWDCVARVTVDGDKSLTATELWQVKVWLRRKVPKTLETSANGLIERMQKHAPRYASLPKLKAPTDPHLLEMCLFDAHFGKLAWSPETGEDYDLKIAEQVFAHAVIELIGQVGTRNIERIAFPFGNDFFHFNDEKGQTEHGTQQDTDSRLAKVVEVGTAAFIRAVDLCLSIAPVEIPWVPGNHDATTSYFVARELKAWYRHNPRVTVDCEPKRRKCIHYGTNLIGYDHGRDVKPDRLAMLMPVSWPDKFAASTCREWKLGHWHKEKAVEYPSVESHNGVTIRWIPSLAGADAYHYQHGYIGNTRAAHAYLYSRDRGFAGFFVSNVAKETP